MESVTNTRQQVRGTRGNSATSSIRHSAFSNIHVDVHNLYWYFTFILSSEVHSIMARCVAYDFWATHLMLLSRKPVLCSLLSKIEVPRDVRNSKGP